MADHADQRTAISYHGSPLQPAHTYIRIGRIMIRSSYAVSQSMMVQRKVCIGSRLVCMVVVLYFIPVFAYVHHSTYIHTNLHTAYIKHFNTYIHTYIHTYIFCYLLRSSGYKIISTVSLWKPICHGLGRVVLLFIANNSRA